MIVELLLFGSLAFIVLIPVIGDNPNDVLREQRLARVPARSRAPSKRHVPASQRITGQEEAGLVDHWNQHCDRADVKRGRHRCARCSRYHLSDTAPPDRRRSPL